jgi:hypothetical protein
VKEGTTMATAATAPAEAGAGTSEEIEGTQSGPDATKGKLFEVPRVGVIIDETDPTVIKLSFSGGIELDRTNADDVSFYNRLTAGKTVSLEIEAHVGTTKTTHRRDSEGNVDAVVQSKSLTVHSIDNA